MVPLTTEKFVSQKVDFNKLHHKLNEKFSNIIEKWKYANKALVSFFKKNCDSPHARLNSHYEAWSYKKKKHKKDYSILEICLERTSS